MKKACGVRDGRFAGPVSRKYGDLKAGRRNIGRGLAKAYKLTFACGLKAGRRSIGKGYGRRPARLRRLAAAGGIPGVYGRGADRPRRKLIVACLPEVYWESGKDERKSLPKC